jgi:hypothetical protein
VVVLIRPRLAGFELIGDGVKSLVRSLSASGEFFLVILVGFGPMTVCQLLNLVDWSHDP